MAEIKDMYKKVVQDKFPDTITIDMGGQILSYRKKEPGASTTRTKRRTSSAASATVKTRTSPRPCTSW